MSLLLSQTLGQLHAVKHVNINKGLGTAVHAAGAHDIHGSHGSDRGRDSGGFFDLLFSSHGSASDCRLYDHLSDGQAMPIVLAGPLPIVLPTLLVAIFAGDSLARWAALFDARGPPLTV